MSFSQQAAKEPLRPGSNPDAEAIRAQLNRLLAHSLFTNSKRYPVLLAYTVEQTLLGNAAELKERTIGVEAFGRDPEYDVNLDPVVRTSAAEVRRRLVQYYYDPTHAGELIIELSAGSYVPAFREPEAVQTDAERELGSDAPVLVPELRAAGVDAPDSGAGARSGFGWQHWLITGLLVLLALGVGVGVGRFHRPRPLSVVDRFWAPMLSSQSVTTYCIGVPEDMPGGRDRSFDSALGAGDMNVSDVVTLARTIVPLVQHHGAFRVIRSNDASFAQLREGPIVLIGAFDNAWTLRITEGLPFGFDNSNGSRLIDRKDLKRSWALEWGIPYKTVATDYAVVGRINDSITGQPVIIAAGLLGEGTEAASEVLSNPEYLNAMLDKAPPGWEKMNLEAVIRTHVIDGNPGPPEIVDVVAW